MFSVTHKSRAFPNITTEETIFLSGSRYSSLKYVHLSPKEEHFTSSNFGHLLQKYYILTGFGGVYIMLICTYILSYVRYRLQVSDKKKHLEKGILNQRLYK